MFFLRGRDCRIVGGIMKGERKVSIVTKKGDNGMTDLYCAGRVLKDDIRCEVCGTIDELCSFLGLAKSMIKQKKTKAIIDEIQNNLFILGSEIAVNPDKYSVLKKRINSLYIEEIENTIYKFEKKVALRHNFIIPGKNRPSAVLDVCRTVARRLERRIVALNNKHLLRNGYILIYVNRISDLLYILSRLQDKNYRW